MSNIRVIDGVTKKQVFSMFITINGQRIYRKNGRPFCFWVTVE